jgi:FkbM family methyltransferase
MLVVNNNKYNDVELSNNNTEIKLVKPEDKLSDENLKKLYVNNINKLLNIYGGCSPDNKSGYLIDNEEYIKYINNEVVNVYYNDFLPNQYVSFLYKLKSYYNFEPKVCYDIGSCVLHWTRHAENIWKNTKIILFDAFEPCKILYQGYDYSMGPLSNIDYNPIKFYQHDLHFGGNSYYREVGHPANIFNKDVYLNKITRTLDSVVKDRNFLYPDLIKIDTQGAELDILKGSTHVLEHASIILVECQHEKYNDGAPLYNETNEYLESIGWKCLCNFTHSLNNPDSDYCYYNTKKLTF